MKVISVSKKEAVDIIGLLAAQVANVTLSGNHAGAAPSLNILEHGVIKYRLLLCVESE